MSDWFLPGGYLLGAALTGAWLFLSIDYGPLSRQEGGALAYWMVMTLGPLLWPALVPTWWAFSFVEALFPHEEEG